MADQLVALHGQATLVVQAAPNFHSPYAGTNSLMPDQVKQTVDITLFAGARPWHGAELWANPEIDQGFGLSDTLGAAGFPSAEAYKVGKKSPYVRLQRLFLRQTINLGGPSQAVDGAANQLARSVSQRHIIVTIGKFSVGDIFDINSVAHDPRSDFLNWAAVDAGTFDYAADAWGYSAGVAAEYYRDASVFRLGLFNLSKVPNGETLESDFSQYQIDGEVEHLLCLGSRPGTVRLTIFRNFGRFGRYVDALANARVGSAPDLSTVRTARTRWGANVNLEQSLNGDVKIFGRVGWADGRIEPYDFTDIDRSLELGTYVAGDIWGRENDAIGLTVLANGLTDSHKRYLAAGGLGVLVGDGQLPHYGTEFIGESYYRLAIRKGVDLSLDAQLLFNPAYNKDRGPIPVGALRLHGAF